MGTAQQLLIAGGIVVPAVTFDPVNKGSDATLSNGNLTAVFLSTGGNGTGAHSTTSYTASGKHYCEFHIDSVDGLNHSPQIGLVQPTAFGGPSWDPPGANTGSGGGWMVNQGGTLGQRGGFAGTVAGFTTGDVIQVAADFGNQLLWFGKNNTWYSGNPSAGTGALFSMNGLTYAAGAGGPGGSSNGVTAHFSLASFTYTPPTGFSPW